MHAFLAGNKKYYGERINNASIYLFSIANGVMFNWVAFRNVFGRLIVWWPEYSIYTKHMMNGSRVHGMSLCRTYISTTR